MRTPIFVVLAALFTLLACSPLSRKGADADISNYWVNSSRVDCTGVGPQTCLQIKRGNESSSGKWENFYADIAGFDFESGYFYQLRVKETPRTGPTPADASSITYTLVEIVEKRLDTKLRLNDIWALTRIGIEDIDASNFGGAIEHPTIEFQLAEKRVAGTNGCNNFTGELLKVGDRSIEIGPLAMTRKACMGSRIPDRFTTALGKVTAYQLDELTLSLLNVDGAEILRFKKVD